MRRIVNPQQTRLFDSFNPVLTDQTQRLLLDEPLRTRYAPGVNQLFGAIGKDNESRRLLRQQVAEDMYLLIRRFADTAEHSGRDTYKSMERIFYEQCEVLDNLEESELLPREMLADTHYCSDENVQDAAERGVELVGPAPSGAIAHKEAQQLNIDDFNIDEDSEEVVCCPAGHDSGVVGP